MFQFALLSINKEKGILMSVNAPFRSHHFVPCSETCGKGLVFNTSLSAFVKAWTVTVEMSSEQTFESH